MQELDSLAQTFHRFAELECPGMSSLYESLCHSLAEEQDLLALAANARSGQPAPNLFMAAVHWLLTKGAQHTVTEYYPDISPEMTTHGDPYPIFRSFCLEHGDEIVDLISTRLVQTNVVRRCAVLLPAFAVAMGRDAGQPLSLVEIGANAGLKLLWDRYSYTYSDAQRWGDPDHPVQLSSIIRGDLRPPLPDSIPKVVFSRDTAEMGYMDTGRYPPETSAFIGAIYSLPSTCLEELGSFHQIISSEFKGRAKAASKALG